MSFFYRIAIQGLRWIDAEKIHHMFLRFLRVMGRANRRSSLRPGVRWALGVSPALKAIGSDRAAVELFGIGFRNRVCLAAGLDKNAEALEGLQLLDFAAIEVGTVTPLGQIGNPKPRLFRDYSQELIFNAMGFNNLGAEEMQWTLEKTLPLLRHDLVLGINIGKNAATPIEEARRDYASCVRTLQDYAHYLTVNVSSPNTKGLRGLQNFTALAPILEGVFQEIEKSSKRTPVLIKLAPEMPEEVLAELLVAIEKEFPVSGWILTNTLQRECPFPKSAMKIGGISGAPMLEASREALRIAVRHTKKPIVSSGGILNVEEAQERLRLGASLVQIYSGLIFRGPSLIRRLANELR